MTAARIALAVLVVTALIAVGRVLVEVFMVLVLRPKPPPHRITQRWYHHSKQRPDNE